MTGILTNFSGRDALLWGHQPLKVTHDLGDQALFSRAALARLIETYPREHYGLIAMGGTGDSKLWQEGDLGGASGEAVLDAIEKGRLWLNLRNVSGVNPAHGLLLDTIFSELRQRLPGFDATKWQSGILISSPGDIRYSSRWIRLRPRPTCSRSVVRDSSSASAAPLTQTRPTATAARAAMRPWTKNSSP